MSKIYRGEMQDNLGNTIYPHTEAGLVYCSDGETVQEKIAGTAETLDGITGVSDSTELDDSTKLATSKAVNTLRSNVNSSLKDSNTNESFNFGSLNGVRGFFTDPSRADDSFIPFSTRKTETFSGFTTAQKEYSITLSQAPHELICLKSNSGYGVSFPADVQLSGTNEDPPKYLSYGYTAFVGLSVKHYPNSKEITFKVTDHTVENGGQIIVNYI